MGALRQKVITRATFKRVSSIHNNINSRPIFKFPCQRSESRNFEQMILGGFQIEMIQNNNLGSISRSYDEERPTGVKRQDKTEEIT